MGMMTNPDGSVQRGRRQDGDYMGKEKEPEKKHEVEKKKKKFKLKL
ncbi:MAG TPA: hypothetical protein VLM75_03695 [Spirochaetota bacterium]|nr:hypothetical protein [Spirochaetota bacterium]